MRRSILCWLAMVMALCLGLDLQAQEKKPTTRAAANTQGTDQRPAQTRYVNVQTGSDQNDGLSEKQAFATIGRACQKLVPGGTVLIAPGIYFEQVRIEDAGTAERPITIKAMDSRKNAVILTLADPALRQGKQKWELVDKELLLYSTTCDHWPARVFYDQIGLMPYPTLDTLKRFALLDDYPAPSQGFTYIPDEKKLYVRLHVSGKYGSSNPNEHVMAVSPVNANGFAGQYFKPNSLDANLVIDGQGDAFVEVDGLTFETPGAVGVLAMRHHVTVRNSFFVGCRFGVGGRASSPDPRKTTHFVTVDHCEYSCKPIFDEMVEIIEKYHDQPIAQKFPFFWWHRKGMNTDSNNIKNDETGILGNIGSNWVLKNCDIHDTFEGITTWGASWADHLTITHNRFVRLVDNAIETENHAAFVTIDHNWIEDVFEPISWQPLGGIPWPGPIFIFDNVIVQTESFGKMWSLVGHEPGVFKIGASDKNWSREQMGPTDPQSKYTLISKRLVAAPDPGFLVYHNTVVSPHSNLLTLTQPTLGPTARELANFRFYNNIFVTQKLFTSDEWKGSLMEFDGNLNVCLQAQSPTAAIAGGADGKIFQTIEQAGFVNAAKNNFALQAGSPAQQLGVLVKGLLTEHRPAGADWEKIKSLAGPH